MNKEEQTFSFIFEDDMDIPHLGNQYRDVSFRQVYTLICWSRDIRSFSPTALRVDQAKQRALLHLRQQLGEMRQSLAPRQWRVIIWDFLTFQFIKVWVLNWKLPEIINTVNRLIEQIPPPSPPVVPQNNPVVHSSSGLPQPVTVPPSPPVVPQNSPIVHSSSGLPQSVPVRIPPSPPVVSQNSPIAHPRTLQPSTTSSSSSRPSTAQNRVVLLPTRVSQKKIEEKLSLMLRAYEVFQREREEQLPNHQQDNEWVRVATEVNDYFHSTIQKLTVNENVPLPQYYHATRNGLEAIARDKNLRATLAPMGWGTYFSTRDEHYNAYGDHTYAVDAEAIEHLPAAYFGSLGTTGRTGEELGLWIRVEANVPVSGENVAYVIVPNEQERTQILENFWQGRHGDEIGFYAPIVTRPASDWIRKCLTAVHRHLLPQTWRLREFSSPIRLQHVQERRSDQQAEVTA